jgi:hypothetical protein
MALVRSFVEKRMERNSLHDEIDASVTVFDWDGRVLVQIDTYGRDTREKPGKKSQSIQLDREGASALVDILRAAFRLS